jgi:hypothetical protein
MSTASQAAGWCDRAPEEGANEDGIPEVSVPEVGIAEVGAMEHGAGEVGAIEDGAHEVGAYEVKTKARMIGAPLRNSRRAPHHYRNMFNVCHGRTPSYSRVEYVSGVSATGTTGGRQSLQRR